MRGLCNDAYGNSFMTLFVKAYVVGTLLGYRDNSRQFK